MDIQQVVNRFLVGLLGSRNERIIRRYAVIAEQIDALEPEFREKSPEQLLAMTGELRQRLREGQTPADILPEAFATVREASRRARQHRHFKVQLVGGMVLYHNDIAEMKTGEGKTIVCYLAIYLKALEGKKVHVITLNDYLVKRDAEFALPIFELLGADGSATSRARWTPGAWRGSGGTRTPATSPTAPTASSASTTCATT